MNIIQQLTTEFGIVKEYPETTIYYQGDDDSGVTVVIDTDGPASNIRINRVTGGEYIIVDSTKLSAIVSGGIQAFDHIEINTRKGKKSATLTRNGVKHNILRALNTSKQWIRMEHGNNVFTFNADSGVSYLRVYLDYSERFNGV